MKYNSFYAIFFVTVALIAFQPSFSSASQRKIIEDNFQKLIKTKSCLSCDLTGVVLNRVDLAGAQLEGANLSGAKLYLANLAEANLKNANLQNAGMGGADLAQADLRGANLTGAVLEGAYLKGALLEGSIMVSKPVIEDDAVDQEQNLVSENEIDKPEESKGVKIGKRRDFGEVPPGFSAGDTEMASPKKTSLFVDAKTDTKDEGKPDKSTADELVQSKKIVQIADVVLEEGSAKTTLTDSNKEEIKESDSEEKLTGMSDSDEDTADQEPGFFDRVSSFFKNSVSSDNVEGESSNLEAQEKVESASPSVEVAGEQGVVGQEGAAVVNSVPVLSGKTKDKVPVKKIKGQEILANILMETNRCVACNLAGLDFSGADLDDADLERSNLQGANLSGVDFGDANLKGVNFQGADLQNADFREADLYMADFTGADLTGALFEEALVDLVNFTDAQGVNLEGAIREE